MKLYRVICGFLLLLLFGGGAQATPALVDSQWLMAHQGSPDLVIVDLQSPKDYQRAHFPGAVNSDYSRWRTSAKSKTPKSMPSVSRLESMIGGLGIDKATHVVLVPFGRSAGDMASATRIYWTFKALGHEKISILNGGLLAYARGGRNRPLEKKSHFPKPKTFKAHLNPDYLVDKTDVQKAMDNAQPLVDNRSVAEYLGLYQGGAKDRAGTIPGALNLPYEWLMVNGGGMFHDPEDLKAIYTASGVPLEGEQISFCQTGHRTSLGWFVSHELLGNKKARLYDGSMAEWGASKELPTEKKIPLQCKAC
jgi:thiosulfate/3-mercaptopyruvate sulfurtransferase